MQICVLNPSNGAQLCSIQPPDAVTRRDHATALSFRLLRSNTCSMLTTRSAASADPALACCSGDGSYLATLFGASDTRLVCWQWASGHLVAHASLGTACGSLLADPVAHRCWTASSPRQLHIAQLAHNDHAFDVTNAVHPVRALTCA